jgi:hypothetical protein
MDTQIVIVFCLSDDLLKALHHYEDPQCQMGATLKKVFILPKASWQTEFIRKAGKPWGNSG